MLARELGAYDVVNVGAAGTLVVRQPGSRAKFLAELRRKLPFKAEVAFCTGSDLIRLEMENPFGAEPSTPGRRSIREHPVESWSRQGCPSLIALPQSGEWFVRIIGSKNRLVFGLYRRHMKTIGYRDLPAQIYGWWSSGHHFTRPYRLYLVLLCMLSRTLPVEAWRYSVAAPQIGPPTRHPGPLDPEGRRG